MSNAAGWAVAAFFTLLFTLVVAVSVATYKASRTVITIDADNATIQKMLDQDICVTITLEGRAP